MHRNARLMLAAAVTATVATMLAVTPAPAATSDVPGYHYDAGTDTYAPLIPASVNAQRTAEHATAAAGWLTVETSTDTDPAALALATLNAATDAALVTDALNAPAITPVVTIEHGNALALAALEGRINNGERFAFPPRPGNYEVIGTTDKGYRVQRVRADGNGLVKGKTFTVTADEWNDAARV